MPDDHDARWETTAEILRRAAEMLDKGHKPKMVHIPKPYHEDDIYDRILPDRYHGGLGPTPTPEPHISCGPPCHDPQGLSPVAVPSGTMFHPLIRQYLPCI